MSNPQTFYKVGGIDLSNIFQPYNSGNTKASATGYTVTSYGDLNNIFSRYTAGGPQALPTGYKVGLNDLNTIFDPLIFTTTASYTSKYSGGYYTIFLESSGNIIFYKNLPSVQIVVVGGGGGGGANSTSFVGSFSGGGGGAGGHVSNNTGQSLISNALYSFTIGTGGVGGVSAGVGQTGGTSTFGLISSNGGLGGNPVSVSTSGNTTGGAGATGGGGGGGGGQGGTYFSTNSIAGSTGISISIDIPGYFFGGGGAGGSYNGQGGAAATYGGAGGGGGSGSGGFANNDTSWTSPTGTPNYPVGYNTPTNSGWAYTGGGGAGGNGNQSQIYRSGGSGGAGTVVLYFQYP